MEEKKVGLVDKIKNYLKETQAEMRKVAWPNRKYVWTATSIIVIMVFALAGLLMVVDYGLSRAIVMLTRVR